VFAERSDSGIAGSAGAARGAREASTELSLAKLDDSVLQPPKAKPRIAKTIRTGQTRELERTVPPLVLTVIAAFEPATLNLFAQQREASLKRDVMPALFLASPRKPRGPPSTGHAETKLFSVCLVLSSSMVLEPSKPGAMVPQVSTDTLTSRSIRNFDFT
jgi:hypothetical protein